MLLVMPQRYYLEREPAGTWAVIDRVTGQVAILDGRLLKDLKDADDLVNLFHGQRLVSLDLDDAEDLVDILNAVDRIRRGEP
jgi:hypothetical protein